MRQFRRIILAMLLAVSAGALMTTAPAQADPGPEWVEICIPPTVIDPETGEEVRNDNCPNIYLGEFIEPPCPVHCGPWFNVWDFEIDPVWQWKYFHEFNLGLNTLIESRLTEKPELAERLRNEATERFLYAAQLRNGTEVQLFGVGWRDGKSGEVFKDETGLLGEIGVHFVDGQQLMMKALDDPELVGSAMASYDAALDGFEFK